MNDISEKNMDWKEKFREDFRDVLTQSTGHASDCHNSAMEVCGCDATRVYGELLDFIQLQREEARNELLEEIFGKDNHQACAYGYRCSRCIRDIPFVEIDSLEKGE